MELAEEEEAEVKRGARERGGKIVGGGDLHALLLPKRKERRNGLLTPPPTLGKDPRFGKQENPPLYSMRL